MGLVERAGARKGDVHLRNDRIADRAHKSRFESSTHVPFLCECGDPACGEFVRLTLPEYGQARRSGKSLVSPGHDGTRRTLATAS